MLHVTQTRIEIETSVLTAAHTTQSLLQTIGMEVIMLK